MLSILVISQDSLSRVGLSAQLRHSDPDGLIDSCSPTHIQEYLQLQTFDALILDLSWQAEDLLMNWQLLDLPTLILLNDDASDIFTILPMVLEAGQPYGLLYRDASIEQIRATLHALLAGLIILDPEIPLPLPENPSQTIYENVDPLSPRESEVLDLLAQGQTNRAIAYHLQITEHTVKFHVNAIMTKLHASSRTEAVIEALRSGLINL
ncbi:response regulator transcription factor [Anaerolineales bacterium]